MTATLFVVHFISKVKCYHKYSFCIFQSFIMFLLEDVVDYIPNEKLLFLLGNGNCVHWMLHIPNTIYFTVVDVVPFLFILLHLSRLDIVLH